VEAPTREAALQAARRLDPDVEPTAILPTELALTFIYTHGRTGDNAFRARATLTGSQGR